MNKRRFDRFDDFLAVYARIHTLDHAYGRDSDPVHLREAARSLYEQSIGFIDSLPWDRIKSVLDVGFGYGFHCENFVRRGARVVGATADLSPALREFAQRIGFDAIETDMHFLDFEDDSFDMVWSSHSLEHSFSPMLALWEWRRVLRPGGVLAVSVPPHKSKVVSGHFCTGWTVGQLMYVLGCMGFDLQHGRFLREGYNVRALVQKPTAEVSFDGLSWMDRLADRLPKSVQAILEEHPRSPGHVQFEGLLREVTPDRCVPLNQSQPTVSLVVSE